MVVQPAGDATEGLRDVQLTQQCEHGVTKSIRSGTRQESWAAEGNSPVHETYRPPARIPSNSGSGKARVNLPGPPGKAKYSLTTDSARVP